MTFRARLRALHLQAGGPSYDELRAHASHAGRNLPTSTINDLLRGRVLSRWRTVAAFVDACHRHATSHRLALTPDTFDLTRWQIAHREALDSSTRTTEAAARIADHVGQSFDAVPPRQLPGAPRLFVGRTDELAQLSTGLAAENRHDEAVPLMVIGGAGGIGKTSLALHWAHQHIKQFPDGQMYLNLRGFAPSGGPMSSASGVRALLDALGVDPVAVPSTLDAQAALYRSLTYGRRILIVLDNAHDSTQVAPLLPGSPTCTVLVTSRNQLTGLLTTHGARPLTLDVLVGAEARALLVGHLGERATTEPDAVTDLLDPCAGLPLALTIVAARAATHPDLPLPILADELRSVSSRLDALDAGELTANLRAVFSWSYQDLGTDAARLFALLGLAMGPDISLAAAASLVGLPADHTRALLHELDQIRLVHHDPTGRYRMHDLVRIYAAEQATAQEPNGDVTAARRRLVDFYLHSANTADHILDPQMQPIQIDRPAAGCSPFRPDDRTEALIWFTAEHACLLATQRAMADLALHADVWRLAWVLDSFHLRQGHLHDNRIVWRAALQAANLLADRATMALARRYYGRACARVGDTVTGIEHLAAALVFAEETGDLGGTAHIHYSLAWTWELQGDHQQALTHATRALRLFQQWHSPVWEARLLTIAGAYNARLGHYGPASISCEQALILHRAHHDHDGEIEALDNLGFIAHQTGDLTTALRNYLNALDLCHQAGHSYAEAGVLTRLGDTYAALNRTADARSAWSRAFTEYRTQYRVTDAQAIQQRLTATPSTSPTNELTGLVTT
jgi:tetratricopeptide (TPR) repeat protein